MCKAMHFIILLSIVQLAWSFCYISHTCFDPDTSKPVTTDRAWDTLSCHRCSCRSNQVAIMTCYEIDVQPIPVNDSESSEQNDHQKDTDDPKSFEWNQRREIVEIPEGNVSSFQCPDLVGPILDQESEDFIFPRLKQVEYVAKRREMECCSRYFTPVNVDTQNCDVIWRKEECRYDVIDKETGGPCPSSYGYVGK